jgi:hypothetical protein
MPIASPLPMRVIQFRSPSRGAISSQLRDPTHWDA